MEDIFLWVTGPETTVELNMIIIGTTAGIGISTSTTETRTMITIARHNSVIKS
jgi:hypothetical protein